MPYKQIALGAILLLAGLGSAETKTYTVRKGDTITDISSRLGVRQKDLLEANSLANPNRLQIGMVLKVPTSGNSARTASTPTNSPPTKSPPTKSPSTSGAYTVKGGDTDWSIARRHNIKVSQLHTLNPGVDWRALRIGSKLKVPGTPATPAPAAPVAKAPPAAAAPVATAAATTSSNSQRRTVTSKDGVVVRRTPAANGPKVRKVGQGLPVTVLETRVGWQKVRFGGGTAGWITNDSLTTVTGSAIAQKPAPRAATSTVSTAQLIENARSFQGVRYRYGGNSRAGIDCSGFTVQVFASMGIRLPRTSAEQARVGQAVDKSQLRKGDLVFFRTGRSTRINHVGIFIGAGKFIHASSGGGRVMESALNEGYYLRRYAGARRVGTLSAVVLDNLANEAEKDTDTEAPPPGVVQEFDAR